LVTWDTRKFTPGGQRLCNLNIELSFDKSYVFLFINIRRELLTGYTGIHGKKRSRPDVDGFF